jgi:hypothetical protein
MFEDTLDIALNGLMLQPPKEVRHGTGGTYLSKAWRSEAEKRLRDTRRGGWPKLRPGPGPHRSVPGKIFDRLTARRLQLGARAFFGGDGLPHALLPAPQGEVDGPGVKLAFVFDVQVQIAFGAVDFQSDLLHGRFAVTIFGEDRQRGGVNLGGAMRDLINEFLNEIFICRTIRAL